MDNRRRMMWKKPPEYAIYYTSTDGNIVTPYSRASWGGAKIMSNTYENGEGKIVFDKKVTKLYQSFYNCSKLKSIILPDSVVTIEYYAFYNCSGLTEISIPDYTDFNHISGRIFGGCTSLKKVILGVGVTTLEGVFSNNSNLSEVHIPNLEF